MPQQMNQALNRSAFVTKSIPASVLFQKYPCKNETCTMFRQDRQKASFYDARIWFPSFCYAREGTAQVMTTEVVKKNPKFI